MGQRQGDQPTLPSLVQSLQAAVPGTDQFRAKRADRQSPPPILPRDLEQALTRLDQTELMRLAEAVTLEVRRGSLSVVSAGAARSSASRAAITARQDQRVTTAPSNLSQSRMNAMRAAIKAGVKPTVVARQFGISLPMVRKVLADEQK